MANLYARLRPDCKKEVTRCASQTVDAVLETWEGKLHLALDADGHWELREGQKHETAHNMDVVCKGVLHA